MGEGETNISRSRKVFGSLGVFESLRAFRTFEAFGVSGRGQSWPPPKLTPRAHPPAYPFGHPTEQASPSRPEVAGETPRARDLREAPQGKPFGMPSWLLEGRSGVIPDPLPVIDHPGENRLQ